jgi:hypothetical protein
LDRRGRHGRAPVTGASIVVDIDLDVDVDTDTDTGRRSAGGGACTRFALRVAGGAWERQSPRFPMSDAHREPE